MKKSTIIDVTIASGSNSATPEVKLNPGKVVAMALYADGEPSSRVNVRIDKYNGDEIYPSTHYKHFERSAGSYMESFKPILIDGQQTITVVATSIAPLTGAFNFQIVFLHSDSE